MLLQSGKWTTRYQLNGCYAQHLVTFVTRVDKAFLLHFSLLRFDLIDNVCSFVTENYINDSTKVQTIKTMISNINYGFRNSSFL